MCIPSKYIDPFTDFGFKWLFGNIKHKRILIQFLNDLIDDLKSPIVDIEYINLEKLGLSIIDRKAIFDIYCTDESGDHFIVELQRSKQKYFKDRSIYYTSFPIQEQAKRGDWDYRLNRVYFIGLLEFNIDDKEHYIKKVSLFDEFTKEKFYDKLTLYYIETKKFKKKEEELSSQLDYWLYVLNNLPHLTDIPEKLENNEVMQEFFDVAEFLKLSKDEQFAYQQDLKSKLDYINVLRYAKETAEEKGFNKGLETGIEKTKIEIAKKSLLKGLDIETVKLITNLTKEEIEKIKKDL